MTLSMAALLGLQTRFHVTVDGVDLGGWGRCSGLDVDFDPVPIKEGGNYDYQPILSGSIKYTPITLERAMTRDDSLKVQQWLRTKVGGWVYAPSSVHGQLGAAVGAGLGTNSIGALPGGAKITLLDTQGDEVLSWNLRNVYPAKWSGPELDAATAGIAKEKLMLVHEGFL